MLVEQLLEKAAALRDLGDESEDWSVRIAWMQSLIAELWKARGLYPGVTRVLDHLAFRSAIAPFKSQFRTCLASARELRAFASAGFKASAFFAAASAAG